jgi:hypothetical protein
LSDQPPAGAGESLQFDQVDLPAAADIKSCALCQTQITDTYYEAGGAVVCPACSEKLTGRNVGAKAFPRALLYGAGAALLGTIVWFLIMKLADLELGIIAIAVGFFVGRAVRVGSGGRGGWRYQALAMFLTYASICSSYVPFIIKGFSQISAEKQEEVRKKAVEKAKVAGADEAKAQQAGEAAVAEKIAADKGDFKPSAGGLVLAILAIFALAFASPFMAGVSNFMGLIIIAIALYEAWKLNKRIVVSGPFRMAAPAMATAAGSAAGTP